LSIAEQPERRLRWDACLNVRDVGGYPTVSEGRTRWGALVRSDSLCRLTPEGRTALLGYGIRTVIDLRQRWELEVAPNPFAGSAEPAGPLVYLTLPLSDSLDEPLQVAFRAASTHRDWNRISLDRCAANLAAVVRAVADARAGGILIHCHAGKDRTGAMVALLLALAEVPDEVIAQDYALSEVYLKELYDAEVRRFTGSAAMKARMIELMRSDPATILDTLSYVHAAHGGARAYFRAAGLSERDLDRVRERLVE
jgi:protein-tyrosine phosphatase